MELPISSRLVADDSMWSSAPLFAASDFITNSAIGERHMFPWHTNIIFFIIINFLLKETGIE